MSTYQQLTREQRYQIDALLKQNCTQTEIAESIGVHKSTVSRELKRNRGLRGYRPKQADEFAATRRAEKAKPRLLSEDWKQIQSLVREDWSPEQISLWLWENSELCVSHEWIYLHIYQDKAEGGTLHQHLRCQKKRRKRYGGQQRRGQIVNRISIDERPAIVETRTRLGDWENDLIIGKSHKQAIVSMVDRKSRLTRLAKVPRKTADLVEYAIVKKLTPLHVYTCTFDNGKEFANHENMSRALGADMYFAHPYSSWERGTNENTNGLVRQYFPKGRDFQTITEKELAKVEARLNNRPRKCLGMKTPNQVFFGIDPPVALTC